jgi:hypothetical protein
MIKQLALASVAALALSSGAAIAQEGPKQAFDATYVTAGPAGSSTVRMVSDGKGHMRTETITMGQKMVSILDYPGKVAITLIEAQKMAMKTPLKPGTDVHDTESAKKANAKSLGARVVNGHPSHGWEYQIPGGGISEVWTGDDINYLVKSITNTPQGKMTMELKEFKKSAPGPEAFQIPAGYKMMAMPGS